MRIRYHLQHRSVSNIEQNFVNTQISKTFNACSVNACSVLFFVIFCFKKRANKNQSLKQPNKNLNKNKPTILIFFPSLRMKFSVPGYQSHEDSYLWGQEYKSPDKVFTIDTLTCKCSFVEVALPVTGNVPLDRTCFLPWIFLYTFPCFQNKT